MGNGPTLLLTWLFILATATLAVAEDVRPRGVAPQMIVTVYKHATGADMVRVAAVRPGYPSKVLAEQCRRVGQNLGSEARGLSVYEEPLSNQIKATKASFAVDGLIDRDQGEFRLQALVRGFLGVPEPYTVRSLLVAFEGETPVPGKTLSDYRDSSVQLTAQASPSPALIEYRILALTQDPERLTIPSRHEPTALRQPSAPARRADDGPGPAVLILLGLASAAALALVHFTASKSRARPESRH